MKKIGLLVMVVLMIALTPVMALAVDWYVDAANGDDANNAADVHAGFDIAYRTIGQAVADAANGDVIYVNSGTYGEYVYVTNSNISIIGVGNVIIDGNMRYRNGIGVMQYSQGLHVENITFQNCSYGIAFDYNYTNTITNCSFRDNGTGIHMQGYVKAVARGCLFYDNSYGIYLYSTGPDARVWNCTFADNYMGLYTTDSRTGEYVHYSLFANNTYGYYINQNTSPNKVRYCNFWESPNYAAGLPSSPNFEPIYELDPEFVDQAGRNYYLSATSPLLDLRIKDETGRLATIGALKCGFASNNNFDNWTDWLDDQGAALGASGKVELVAEGVTLKEGVASATIVSPVFDSGNTMSKLVRVRYDAIEFESEDPGYKSYIDYDLNTPEQEIRYRVSNNVGNMGAWQTANSNDLLEIAGRYCQVELILHQMQ